MNNTAQINDLLIEKYELNDRQVAAIIALMSEPTIKKAAEVANVSRSGLYRWLNEDPDFSAAYREARKLVFEAGLVLLQSSVGLAAKALCEVAQDPNASPASRVAAADKILVHSRALHDPVTIDRQISELQMRLGGDDG